MFKLILLNIVYLILLYWLIAAEEVGVKLLVVSVMVGLAILAFVHKPAFIYVGTVRAVIVRVLFDVIGFFVILAAMGREREDDDTLGALAQFVLARWKQV